MLRSETFQTTRVFIVSNHISTFPKFLNCIGHIILNMAFDKDIKIPRRMFTVVTGRSFVRARRKKRRSFDHHNLVKSFILPENAAPNLIRIINKHDIKISIYTTSCTHLFVVGSAFSGVTVSLSFVVRRPIRRICILWC